jgi:hypothetical protein
VISDKFDQFWAVNRRMMECPEGEGFKYVPFRCHRNDQLCAPLQRLVKPADESGQPRTLADLVKEILPDNTPESGNIINLCYSVFNHYSLLFLNQYVSIYKQCWSVYGSNIKYLLSFARS